jgi:hypothetical protein
VFGCRPPYNSPAFSPFGKKLVVAEKMIGLPDDRVSFLRGTYDRREIQVLGFSGWLVDSGGNGHGPDAIGI